jgi:hypothetical protein
LWFGGWSPLSLFDAMLRLLMQLLLSILILTLEVLYFLEPHLGILTGYRGLWGRSLSSGSLP